MKRIEFRLRSLFLCLLISCVFFSVAMPMLPASLTALTGKLDGLKKKLADLKLVLDNLKDKLNPKKPFPHLSKLTAADRLIREDASLNLYQIKVNKQAQFYTCGYHALNNAFMLFDFWTKGADLIPVDDYTQFNQRFADFKSKINTDIGFNVFSNPNDADLGPTFFDFIKEQQPLKSFIDNKHLIYFPYSSTRYSILTLSVDDIKEYNVLIDDFIQKKDGFIAWVLGLARHYYLLCTAKYEGQLYLILCDSENDKATPGTNLLGHEKNIITSIHSIVRKALKLENYCLNRFCFEMKNEIEKVILTGKADDLESSLSNLVKALKAYLDTFPECRFDAIDQATRTDLIAKLETLRQKLSLSAIEPTGSYHDFIDKENQALASLEGSKSSTELKAAKADLEKTPEYILYKKTPTHPLAAFNLVSAAMKATQKHKDYESKLQAYLNSQEKKNYDKARNERRSKGLFCVKNFLQHGTRF